MSIYARSTIGTSRGQNQALRQAAGTFVAITDDDCTVPQDWLQSLETLFTRFPRVDVIYCSVKQGPHDPEKGFIPGITFEGTRVLHRLSDYWNHLGFGAGMAFRRSVLTRLAGFDESLGPGSRFGSGADVDMGIRALSINRGVMLTSQTHVVHHGFRFWTEFGPLMSRYYFGSGAFCVKPLRLGRLGILPHIVRRLAIDCLWLPTKPLFRLRRPRGYRRFLDFWQGFFAARQAPIDPQTLRYME